MSLVQLLTATEAISYVRIIRFLLIYEKIKEEKEGNNAYHLMKVTRIFHSI